jgi:hypothetical protein
MSLLRALFSTDLGTNLDVQGVEGDVQRLRDRLHAVALSDRAQTRDLAAAHAEIDELRATVAALVRMLVARGALDAAEVAALAGALERSAPRR